MALRESIGGRSNGFSVTVDCTGCHAASRSCQVMLCRWLVRTRCSLRSQLARLILQRHAPASIKNSQWEMFHTTKHGCLFGGSSAKHFFFFLRHVAHNSSCDTHRPLSVHIDVWIRFNLPRDDQEGHPNECDRRCFLMCVGEARSTTFYLTDIRSGQTKNTPNRKDDNETISRRGRQR